MNFLENYYYFLKKKKFIKFISNFIYLLPDYFVYQIFKNAIRNGQYSLCKKTYDLLNKRKINKNLSERFFISKIVFYEIQLYRLSTKSLQVILFYLNIFYNNLEIFQ